LTRKLEAELEEKQM